MPYPQIPPMTVMTFALRTINVCIGVTTQEPKNVG